jgi:hypothetical protein
MNHLEKQLKQAYDSANRETGVGLMEANYGSFQDQIL